MLIETGFTHPRSRILDQNGQTCGAQYLNMVYGQERETVKDSHNPRMEDCTLETEQMKE